MSRLVGSRFLNVNESRKIDVRQVVVLKNVMLMRKIITKRIEIKGNLIKRTVKISLVKAGDGTVDDVEEVSLKKMVIEKVTHASKIQAMT